MLAKLTEEQIAHLAYRWEGWWARPSQLEPEHAYLYWLILAGRGFGKTRMGAEWIRTCARNHRRLGLIGKDAADMRDVMIEGESGILAISPPWERPTYYPSKRELVWPNGATAHCRTGEDPEGVRGIQFERLWCDEIAAWQYAQETWDMALLATRLGSDVRVCITTTPKPIPVVKELVADIDSVVTSGTTFENLPNLSPTFQTIIRRYQDTRLGRQELMGELLLDEGLAYRFNEALHVVDSFEPPESWDRFESMDYGSSDASATAWLAYAVDYDGNVVVFDELYQPGLPSVTAPLVHDRRERWYPDGNDRKQHPICYADPAIFNPGQTSDRWGAPAVVNNEFAALGIHLVKANNDRRAGYVRIAELLRMDERRARPTWAPLEGSGASPTFFVMRHCSKLIQQLQDAPLEEGDAGPYQGPYPGEAVAKKWEANHGHAHASARYGLLSWPRPSERPPERLDDPRAELQRQLLEKRNQGDLAWV